MYSYGRARGKGRGRGSYWRGRGRHGLHVLGRGRGKGFYHHYGANHHSFTFGAPSASPNPTLGTHPHAPFHHTPTSFSGYSDVPSTTPAPVPEAPSSSGIVWIGSDGQPSAPPSAAALHALMQPAVQPLPPAGSSSTSSPASPGGQDPSRPNGPSVNGSLRTLAAAASHSSVTRSAAAAASTTPSGPSLPNAAGQIIGQASGQSNGSGVNGSSTTDGFSGASSTTAMGPTLGSSTASSGTGVPLSTHAPTMHPTQSVSLDTPGTGAASSHLAAATTPFPGHTFPVQHPIISPPGSSALPGSAGSPQAPAAFQLAPVPDGSPAPLTRIRPTLHAFRLGLIEVYVAPGWNGSAVTGGHWQRVLPNTVPYAIANGTRMRAIGSDMIQIAGARASRTTSAPTISASAQCGTTTIAPAATAPALVRAGGHRPSRGCPRSLLSCGVLNGSSMAAAPLQWSPSPRAPDTTS